MSGKGELVNYTRIVHKGPLTPHDKQVLKDKINAIIDAASSTITIEAMVAPDKTQRDTRGGY